MSFPGYNLHISRLKNIQREYLKAIDSVEHSGFPQETLLNIVDFEAMLDLSDFFSSLIKKLVSTCGNNKYCSFSNSQNFQWLLIVVYPICMIKILGKILKHNMWSYKMVKKSQTI